MPAPATANFGHAIRSQPGAALFAASSALIFVHVLDAALLHANLSRHAAALSIVLTALAVSAGIATYIQAGARARIALLVAFGLPAFIAGAGIHGVHVVRMGFQGSDYTGIPMLAAGIVLMVFAAAEIVRLARR